MSALVEATGVPKSTILYYLGEGLLPAPVKTSPNMAYYDPACVDRIRFIQHLQNRHRLSLAEIRALLESENRGSDLSVYLELNDLIFGSKTSGPVCDAAALCRETGLTPAQLGALRDARLLLPMEEHCFDAQDVAMGGLYARALGLGIRVADLTYYVTLGEKIVEREMALRRRLTGGLPYPQDAATTIAMVKSARMCRAYVIDRLFQHRVAAMPDLKEQESRP